MLFSSRNRLEEPAIASLLRRRYGDDMIHVQSRDDRILMKRALALGLVDASGYLTAAGRDFCAAWQQGVEASLA